MNTERNVRSWIVWWWICKAHYNFEHTERTTWRMWKFYIPVCVLLRHWTRHVEFCTAPSDTHTYKLCRNVLYKLLNKLQYCVIIQFFVTLPHIKRSLRRQVSSRVRQACQNFRFFLSTCLDSFSTAGNLSAAIDWSGNEKLGLVIYTWWS
jgi:hypothetical protein